MLDISNNRKQLRLSSTIFDPCIEISFLRIQESLKKSNLVQGVNLDASVMVDTFYYNGDTAEGIWHLKVEIAFRRAPGYHETAEKMFYPAM